MCSKVQDDKRSNSRQELQLLVTYQVSGKTISNFMFDLSTNGMFIETSVPLKVGEEVSLSLELPYDKTKFNLTAKVMWNRNKNDSSGKPPGMGVQFINVENTEDFKKLEAALKYFKRFENEN